MSSAYWFDVKNRLPDGEQKVLVHLKGGWYLVGRMKDGVWTCVWDESPLCEVTHWADLPPGPRTKEKK